MTTLARFAVYQRLAVHRDRLALTHLRTLFADDPRRFERFSLAVEDLILDFSKNLVTAETLELLVAGGGGRRARRARRCSPASKINVTEDRAVLHVALRNRSQDRPILVDGEDVMPEVQRRAGADAPVHRRRSATGAWRGSYRRAHHRRGQHRHRRLRSRARRWSAEALRRLRAAGSRGCTSSPTSTAPTSPRRSRALDPETTLFIVASKTFTTQETLTNAQPPARWLLDGAGRRRRRPPLRRRVDQRPSRWPRSASTRRTCSASGTGSAAATRSGRRSGCRWPRSIGMDRLRGAARRRPRHGRALPHRAARAEHPGAHGAARRLVQQLLRRPEPTPCCPTTSTSHRFPAYLQQLDMESNGKSVDRDGRPITTTPPARSSGASPAPTASTPSTS